MRGSRQSCGLAWRGLCRDAITARISWLPHGDLLSRDKWRASHHAQPNRLPYAFILIATRDAKCLPRGPDGIQRGLAGCTCHYFLLDKEGNAARWDLGDDGSRLYEWQSITHTGRPEDDCQTLRPCLVLSYFSPLFKMFCLRRVLKSLRSCELSGCCCPIGGCQRNWLRDRPRPQQMQYYTLSSNKHMINGELYYILYIQTINLTHA